MAKKYQNRKPLWKGIKVFLRLCTRTPKFIFLGEKKEFEDRSLYISNHVGLYGPFGLELYFPKLFKFWGIYLMAEGFWNRFNYLYKIHFHKINRVPKIFSFLVTLIAAPLMSLFYWGMQVIPTYPDTRLIKTYKLSLKALERNESIVIFPEDSNNGYNDQLSFYFSGFFVLAKKALSKGMDLLIYNIYYKRKQNTYIVDEPIKFSELLKITPDKNSMAEYIKNRANELGKIKVNKGKIITE